MKRITIDCAAISDRGAFHDSFSSALSFPNWYGRNLDALHDCLAAISEDTHLALHNWSALEAALGNYAALARTVLTHAEDENLHLNVEFC